MMAGLTVSSTGSCGEVVEDVGAGELGEAPAGVERHHVGHVAAHEAGADRRVGVRARC